MIAMLDVRRKMLEKQVEILLTVHISETLKDAKLVACSCFRSFCYIVDS
jgi:hypothetical protein